MRSTPNELEVAIRPGQVEDVPLLLSFIRSMAEYEELDVSATEEGLRKSLFEGSPAAHTLLISADHRPVGYVVYYYAFATMVGQRVLHLEDVYLSPRYRGRGIGRTVMQHLARVAIQNDCARFEWIVLNRNRPAIEFYLGLGARVWDEWRVCRLQGAALRALATEK